MKHLIIGIAITLLVLLPGWATGHPETVVSEEKETVTITDMFDRTVTIPRAVSKVYAQSPVGTYFLYTLNSSKLTGLMWEPSEEEKPFFTADYRHLPVLGGWFGQGNTGNLEEIIKAKPDFIIFDEMAPIGDMAYSREQADRLQETLQIPVVIMDFSFYRLPETYRFAGSLTGDEERAEELASYTEEVYAEIHEKTAALTEEEKVRVYYAEGSEGLQTDPEGSAHSELISFAGAVNAAEIDTTHGYGRAQISPEQLAIWNPDLIVACHDGGAALSTCSALLSDPRLQSIPAISEDRVYEIPYRPFNVTDRPPSVFRIFGVKWLAQLFYPDLFPYDIKKEMQDFYRLFWNIEITDSQAETFLTPGTGE